MQVPFPYLPKWDIPFWVYGDSGERSMAKVVAVALMASLLSGCAGGAGIGSASKSGAASIERFAYAPATDRSVRVTVERALTYQDDGFLPKDRNWIQVELSVANVGARPVQITDVRARFADGAVLATAQTPTELAKPPREVAGLVYTGIGNG